MPDKNIEVLHKETYLRRIENAPGSRLFLSLFVRHKGTGEVEDVLRGGEYSCASFVSSLLVLSGLLDRPRATVASVRAGMEAQGWREVHGAPEPGDVIFWDDVVEADGTLHKHVGFSLGGDEAVSTSVKERMVAQHHLTYGTDADGRPKRKVIAIYRHAFEKSPKLVRDGIPAMIVAKGEKVTSHTADEKEYRARLRMKLREEIDEFFAAENAEELADVREVLDAYAVLLGIAPDDALRIQSEKREKRGGFGGRVVLDSWKTQEKTRP